MGRTAYESEDYEDAVQYLTTSAEQGNAEAQNLLGVCYYYGYGVDWWDNEKAVEWFTKSAEQGYAKAQRNLGICYECGYGVDWDYEKAVEWYSKSAEQGYAKAQCNLGYCYYYGQGVDLDYDKAAEWYSRSAEQGCAQAQYNLGICYQKGRGVDQDSEKALEWYAKAEAQGHESAKEKLASLSGNTILTEAQAGDVITFGHYEQDNDTSNGKEEIEWLVLEKEADRMLVISKYALDCQKYNTEYTSVTLETCSLRKWLNGTFLEEAFNSAESSQILTATVTADKNPEYSTSPGKDTQDKVFLLSITEAEKYFTSNSERACKPTAYAKTQGCYANQDSGNCWWWLRSPGYRSNYAADVNYDGSLNFTGGNVIYVYVAVRPALWINLAS